MSSVAVAGKLTVKQPPVKPPWGKSWSECLETVDNKVKKNRLRVACAVACAAITRSIVTIGPEDPLTVQMLNIAMGLCQKGWDIPCWREKMMYWLDTLANRATWKLPARVASNTK